MTPTFAGSTSSPSNDQGVFGVGDLVEAALHRARLRFRRIRAHVNTKRAVAEILDHPRLKFGVGLILGADEAVQDDKGGSRSSGRRRSGMEDT